MVKEQKLFNKFMNKLHEGNVDVYRLKLSLTNSYAFLLTDGDIILYEISMYNGIIYYNRSNIGRVLDSGLGIYDHINMIVVWVNEKFGLNLGGGQSFGFTSNFKHYTDGLGVEYLGTIKNGEVSSEILTYFK